MFLTNKLMRIYVGLYQKFLYKASLLLTPPSPKILLVPPLMQQRLRLVQGSQCYVLLNKLLPSEVVNVQLPNALPMQRLDDLCVTYQA